MIGKSEPWKKKTDAVYFKNILVGIKRKLNEKKNNNKGKYKMVK